MKRNSRVEFYEYIRESVGPKPSLDVTQRRKYLHSLKPKATVVGIHELAKNLGVTSKF